MNRADDIRDHERLDAASLEAMRRLGGMGRLRAMSDLIDGVRELMSVRVREQHPDWTPEQVAKETARRVAHATA